MWGIFVTECSKLLRGKQVWMAMGIFSVIPILIGLMVTQQGENVTVQGAFNVATYTFTVVGILRSLLVVYLVAIIMSATTLAKESEEGILKMTLVRLPNRWSLYVSKFLAVNAVMILLLILMLIASGFSYLIFIHNTEWAASLTRTDALSVLYAMAAAIGGIAVVIAVTFLFSMSLGFTGAFMAGIGFLILSKVFEQWGVVKEYLPTVLADAARFLADTPEAVTASKQAMLLLPLYVLVLVLPGVLWIERKDISR